MTDKTHPASVDVDALLAELRDTLPACLDYDNPVARGMGSRCRAIVSLLSAARQAPAPQPATSGVPALPAEIAAIVERLHTQDNRITDNPLFAVQQKHQICGLDDGYEESWVWVNSDCEEVRDEEDVAPLNAAFDKGDDTPGYRRVGVADRWEFVTGCFTEQGCQDYIARNGHNLKQPRIYAYGSYRNAEFIALRKWLMSLRSTPTAQPLQATGVEALAEAWEMSADDLTDSASMDSARTKAAA